MSKYYYDTYAFSYFFFTKDFKHKYSPTQSTIEPAFSIMCTEEMLHKSLVGQLKNWGVKKSFTDIWDDLNNFSGLFQEIDVKLSDIKIKLYNILGLLKSQQIDLSKKFSKGLAPNAMDLFHFIIADLAGCEHIITTDNGFEFFQNKGSALQISNVRTIHILDAAKLNLLKTIQI